MASTKLGVQLCKRGHVCVNGGGKYGCMGALNDAIANEGKQAIGVIHKMWIPGGSGPNVLHPGMFGYE